jgi:hypothetical protein
MGQGPLGRTARVWLEWAIVGGLVGALAAALLASSTRASADPELDGWAVAAVGKVAEHIFCLLEYLL